MLMTEIASNISILEVNCRNKIINISVHKECYTFLLPWEFLTKLKISILRLSSSSNLLKLECYFLRFGFSFFYYLWAFLSYFPIDLVELWATLSCSLISPFFSLSISIRCFFLTSMRYFFVNFLSGFYGLSLDWPSLFYFFCFFIVE